MKCPVRPRRSDFTRLRGYTLVEMLVATALTLVLILAVAEIFSRIGRTVNDTRATLETMDQLRGVAAKLQKDLEGHTCPPMPPCRPDDGSGYIEIIEGAYYDNHSVAAPGAISVDSDSGGTADTTVGDPDDIVMLTTRTTSQPFVGLYNSNPVESDVAEVAWFIRGNVLYRRVLLVLPGGTGMPLDYNSPGPGADYNEFYDVSARTDKSKIYPNTLGDLTKREWRYGHSTTFPFSVNWGAARLPTLSESTRGWPDAISVSPPSYPMDYWRQQPSFGSNPRATEDVMLTNVIGFDVKVWDSGAGTYVDIGGPAAVTMTGNGLVYDTWSLHYEHNGIDEDGVAGADQGTNDFDDNSDGVIDDIGERETMPFYPVPLRGIQVKIRVFEPDSRQIREVTVVQDFLPK